MFGEIASSPAINQPDNVPLDAQPQQDSLGNIVGWWAPNADGTVTVWDTQGLNPTTTLLSSPAPPQSMFERWGWTPSVVGTSVGTAAGSVIGATAVAATETGVAAAGAAVQSAIQNMLPILLLVGGGLVLFMMLGPPGRR